jgi:allantoin racemase
MKITIINPNTTGEMTEDICESAHYFSRPESEIRCVNPENGPVTIEGFYDEHIATLGLIEELLKSEDALINNRNHFNPISEVKHG